MPEKLSIFLFMIPGVHDGKKGGARNAHALMSFQLFCQQRIYYFYFLEQQNGGFVAKKALSWALVCMP